MPQKVKVFLKKVFPLALLRLLHLRINALRIHTVDKLVFPEQQFTQDDFITLHYECPFVLYPVKSAHLDLPLRAEFHIENYWAQDEYLLIYDKTCIIEPQFGWALTSDNKLICPSLGFSKVPYLGKPARRVKKLQHTILEEYAEIVSLRDTGEENYYHFYNDVLAKLFFLEERIGLTADVPLLISKKLYEKEFFKYFLTHPYLSQRQWVVQDDQCIRSHRTYFCKPLTHTPQFYSRILDLVRSEDNINPSTCEHKIFVTRNPQRLRFIENNAEVEAVCKEFGFVIIDFDNLTLSQQIRLLKQTRYLVAIHGAGLANMLFRQGHPLGVLEIFPPAKYFPFHYVIMANQLNYHYDGLIGKPGSQPFSSSFRVEPAELRQHISALLQF